METAQITVFVLAAVNLITLGAAVFLGLRVRRLERQVVKPAATRVPNPQPPARREKFAVSLQNASLKGLLAGGTGDRDVPEKYQYATALAERGLEAEEIATILHLPKHEAEQVVGLARLAKGRGESLPGQNALRR